MESNQNLLNNELIVDSVAAGHLKETAMWARIVGACGIGFSILIFLFAIFAKWILEEWYNLYGGSTREFQEALYIVVSVVYGIIGVIAFFASLFQFRFGVRAKRAVATMDQQSLNSSFQNLKGYYRIAGIMAILGTAFFVLSLIVSLTAGRY